MLHQNGINLWGIKGCYMKKMFLLIIILGSISFATKNCIFDALGNCIAPASSSAQYVKKISGQKRYYAWDTYSKNAYTKQMYISVSPRKSLGKKRWYEVDWNQGVKLCPEKEFYANNGVWIVNGAAHIDSLNCVYVDGSPYTRSILVLFAKNENDLKDADSSWILVNQTIVELSKSKHKIWDGRRKPNIAKTNPDSKYIDIFFSYDLIVDRTELTLRDALWLEEYARRVKPKNGYIRQPFYPSDDTLSLLNYPAAYFYLYAQYRSEIDGLDNVMRYNVPLSFVDTNKSLFFHKPNKYKRTIDVFDTSASGYREPLENEWEAIKLGGREGTFFWGDSSNENELGKYLNANCIDKEFGVYPVRQFKENPYGLYDVYGNAEENVAIVSGRRIFLGSQECKAFDSRLYDIGKACEFLNQYKCNYYDKPWNVERFRSIHHGFQGVRLVRKLE